MKKFILLALLISLLLIILGMQQGKRPDAASPGIETPLLVKKSIPFNKSDFDVTVTAYSPTEEECDSDPYITAYQKPVREGTIAISRDLEEELGWHLGDRIHIKDLGVFEVWDRMHPRWKKRVDIFFHDTEKAISFGVKQAKVVKVEKRNEKGV